MRKCISLLALLAGAVRAQEPPATATSGLGLDQAKWVLQAAHDAALAIHPSERFSFTVLDAAGVMVAFARMDGAVLGSVEISAGKARTAALFASATVDRSALFLPGQILFKVDTFVGGSSLYGGVPLLVNGVVQGALGVSGAPSATDDQDVAAAAVANFTASSSATTVAFSNTLFPRMNDTWTRLLAAERAAVGAGTRQSTTVVDELSTLWGFLRMDQSLPAAALLAPGKARATSLSGGRPSGDTVALKQPASPWFSFDNAAGDALVTLPGGLALTRADGTVVGAVGSSGSFNPNVDLIATTAALNVQNVTTYGTVPTLSLATALSAAQLVLDQAHANDSWVTVAVVDAGGHLKLLLSSDGSAPASVELATRKARAAMLLGLSNSILNVADRPGVAYSISFIGGGAVMFNGGEPVRPAGNGSAPATTGPILGGIGVVTETPPTATVSRSATADNDWAARAAALAATGVGMNVSDLVLFPYTRAFGRMAPYAGQIIQWTDLHRACERALEVRTAPITCAGRDGTGTLRYLVREDGAPLLSLMLATEAGRTSFALPVDAGDLQSLVRPDQALSRNNRARRALGVDESEEPKEDGEDEHEEMDADAGLTQGALFTLENAEGRPNRRFVTLPIAVWLNSTNMDGVLGSVAVSSGLVGEDASLDEAAAHEARDAFTDRFGCNFLMPDWCASHHGGESGGETPTLSGAAVAAVVLGVVAGVLLILLIALCVKLRDASKHHHHNNHELGAHLVDATDDEHEGASGNEDRRPGTKGIWSGRWDEEADDGRGRRR